MSIDPNSPVEKGRQALQSGDIQTAINFLSEALHADMSDGRAWGYLGIAQTKLGEVDNGIASLYESSRLQPSDVGAQFNLAVALIQANRGSEARPVLEYAQSLDPQNPRIQQALSSLPAPAPSPFQSPAAPAPLTGAAPQEAGLASGMMAPPPAYAPPPPPQEEQGAAMPQGMDYRPGSVPRKSTREPTTGERMGRGLGWGLLYGQWWTLWNVFWYVVWGSLGHSHTLIGVVVITVIFALIFSVGGLVAGVVIAAANLDISTGATVGIVMGVIFCALEYFTSGGNAGMLINIFFWFYTGRFVGSRIAWRVGKLVQVT